MNIELKITDDGSTTLYNKELNEHYHSTFGAINESMHVYINAGLQDALTSTHTIQLLEIGFGTGLNALLTCLEALENKRINQIRYTSLEPFPLAETITKQLNFVQQIQHPQTTTIFGLINELPWDETGWILENKFQLTKLKASIENFKATPLYYNLVYFDAFAPEVQPELWTEDIFKLLFNSLQHNGTLVTYCAKGAVKRAMKAAGFTIENLPGPIGKREITRGRKLARE